MSYCAISLNGSVAEIMPACSQHAVQEGFLFKGISGLTLGLQ